MYNCVQPGRLAAFMPALAFSLLTSASSLAQARTDRAFAEERGSTSESSSYLVPNIYQVSFAALLIATAILAWFTRPTVVGAAPPPEFRTFQWRYLVVWALAISADWLQGPYVYALYESYGFTSREIAELFVAGFGASMLIGSFIGVITDAWGRKRMSIAYCCLYAASCATKHSSSYSFLMLGRILGGAATSILFSAFECWMVSEHKKRHGFSDALLRYLFGMMFFVQYFVAVVSGLVAQVVADASPMKRVPGFATLHYGGYIGPFDLSLVVLLCCIPMICSSWDENYGDANSIKCVRTSFKHAASAFGQNWQVSCLGIVVAAFEGSMYAFVFNWTPALQSQELPPPHGLIFSTFMMACMCGSSIFTLTDPAIPPARTLLVVMLLSVFALSLVTVCVGQESRLVYVFLGFTLFELCVGTYFPAIGTLKSHLVPEEARAGVYNFYRLPLNMVVVVILLTNLSLQAAFMSCSAFLAVGLLVLFTLQPSVLKSL